MVADELRIFDLTSQRFDRDGAAPRQRVQPSDRERDLARMDARFDQLMARFDQFDRLFFRLMAFTWITTLASIWLKP